MNFAAGRGHLDMVKWFHLNREEGCITDAIVCAAENGHLETVKWLYENSTEDCHFYASLTASKNKHLEVVKYLDEKMAKKFMVAYEGHWRAVEFLEKLRKM